jgi:(p)ppGpp synthase/HD superfamily hydrolase
MRTEKKLLVLRQTLIGLGFNNALRALEFARKYHVGVRKDGITPEFDHQLSIALYVLTLPNLTHREAVIAAVLLHDISEDYHVSRGEIIALFADQVFATLVANGVENVTKKFRGIEKDEDVLFAQMAECPIASIVKPADRMHNLQTMVGVFTPAKQASYCEFAEDRVLPMMKIARRNFPEQIMAYENMKHVIRSQIQLIRAIHAATAA